MLSEDEVLSTLDNTYKSGAYCFFIPLGNPHSYLIDCRLNVFRGENDKWAVAAERLGYSPREGIIDLELFFYGNSLINLEEYNGHISNCFAVCPIEENSIFESIAEPYLKPDAQYWLVRDTKVILSTKKQDYFDNGIELKQYEPDQIGIEEAARLAILSYRNLFRATDGELHKSIPKNLKKILVLDEWYHKDFTISDSPSMSDEHLKYTYEFNKKLTGLGGMSFETFAEMTRAQELRNEETNKKEWMDNRPGSYETWQQLAKVITSGDTSFYNPTLIPNTHWTNWPESGSL